MVHYVVGHRLSFPKRMKFFLKIDFVVAVSAYTDVMCVLQHFFWVLTVSNNTQLADSSLLRVSAMISI